MVNHKSLFLFSALALGCGGVRYAKETPFPAIKSVADEAVVKRGSEIFHTTCEACHRDTGAETVSGSKLHDAPGFIGTLYSANITQDPTHGVGAAKDEEIARVIRYGVARDGRMTMMPSFGMSDGDIAAIVSFMRSSDPVLKATPVPSRPQELSLLGKILLPMVMPKDPPNRPASGITSPARARRRSTGSTLRSTSSIARAVTPKGSARRPAMRRTRSREELRCWMPRAKKPTPRTSPSMRRLGSGSGRSRISAAR